MEKQKSEILDSNTMTNSPTKAETSEVSSNSEIDSTTESAQTNRDKNSTGTDGEENATTIKAHLSYQETLKVDRSRSIVLIILAVTAIAISVVVFHISNNAENEQFMSQYEGAAAKILDSFQSIPTKFGILSTIAIAATIIGEAKNGTNVTLWPFVSIPEYEHRASLVLELATSLSISIHPYVTEENRDKWETYSVGPDKEWIANGLDFQSRMGFANFEYEPPPIDEVLMTNYSRMPMYYYNKDDDIVVDPGPGPYLPKWQSYPVLRKDRINLNNFRQEAYAPFSHRCIETGSAVLSNFLTAPPGGIEHPNITTARIAELLSFAAQTDQENTGAVFSKLFIPIFDNFEADHTVVSVVSSLLIWRKYFFNILPHSVEGIQVVLENSCSGSYTYEINGMEAMAVGNGDLHDPKFNQYERTIMFDKQQNISDGTVHGQAFDLNGCEYELHVYPTSKYSSSLKTSAPILITFAVAMVFAFTILMFLVYNRLVEARQQVILDKAVQSTRIVSSLFPKQVRDRLLETDNKGKLPSGNKLKSFMDGGENISETGINSQIADLFPHCTVMFADIAGFTAWSSTRGPEHVFTLLQTVYQGFDIIAKRRRVFKVETIGDCYVAVTGLPEAQPNHALIMARFAWECRLKMSEMTKDLEVQLGPDCSDLKMRFGMHSGPVTAGVLRGDRARFQLFGDTVNTASRMESTGIADKIQISTATADILITSGKGHWMRPREELVEAKGKGLLKTYWLNPGFNKSDLKSSSDTASSSPSDKDSESGNAAIAVTDSDSVRRNRLVDWMVELLAEHVKKIKQTTKKDGSLLTYSSPPGQTFLDEFKEVIQMATPDYNGKTSQSEELDEEVVSQMREYISILASMYRSNPFHNFEHACHVTMSVSKLLKRIISPELNEDDLKQANIEDEKGLENHLRNCTYGINSDPLAQFAIVFSAIIHDVDHRGCSNIQLAKEEELLGERYRQKSVAEQNSLDLAWDLLMSSQFARLRQEIFGTRKELLRFRQLIINTVLATDIFDKELNDLRKARWEKAFSEDSEATECENGPKQSDIKATIVIEHIIQASDVSHTMQHWQVYQKWNKLLFREMYLAYQNGRMAADPSAFWYKGEIAFFDNYIIPLAKKLKECNVFGVSSDEYLNYAIGNRMEWEVRGEAIVEDLLNQLSRTDDML